MAIIKPSKKFAGSSLDNRSSTKYVKDAVRQVLFNSKENKDGAYLYFLPPYKQDSEGNGVWYKVFKIRDNFGDKFKEKFAVNPRGNCPVDHFERNFKINFPEAAKVVDEVDEKGQTRKRYPLFGRKTNRVLFNVAISNNLEAGNHVLDLPSFMGASQIMEWLDAKDRSGKDRPLLNDPERCIPVFVKLKQGGSGNPWQISPDPTEPAMLPDELADSDNLYNLDEDVLEFKSNDELIEKLKNMYKTDEFELCMEGFEGFDKLLIPGFGPGASAKPAVKPDPAPVVKKTPTVAPSVVSQPIVDEIPDEIPMEYPEDDVTPAVVNKPTVSKESASAFLRRKA